MGSFGNYIAGCCGNGTLFCFCSNDETFRFLLRWSLDIVAFDSIITIKEFAEKAGGFMANEEVLEQCEYMHVNSDLVNSVREKMPDNEKLYDLAELFKVFGEPSRIRILYVLLESEMCVCDIAQLLNMSQSAVSHQLRILKQSRLVKFRKEGTTVFYSLADEHVFTVLSQGLEHIEE